MINHKQINSAGQICLCKILALSLLAVSISNALFAKAQSKTYSGGSKTSAAHRKKDMFSGWEMYQNSKSMGTNRMLLCAGGLKIVNPLMSLAYWPKTNQLVMINNSNHKYFLSSREKFPHYVKLLGFDLFSSRPRDIKYSEWKKLETEKIAGMDSVLYQRKAINMPPDSERKEQTWVSKDITLPENLYEVYSAVSGRPDSCHFGFPMRSKVISITPQDGFKVHQDFDTREVTEKQFCQSDFLPPKDYVLVKEFSEYLLNDSESKSNQTSESGSSDRLQSAVSQFKSKLSAERSKRNGESH